MFSRSACGVLLAGLACFFQPAAHAKAVLRAAANHCVAADFSDAWPCYRQQQAGHALDYHQFAVTPLPGVEKRSYEMTSQQWPESGGASPSAWTHQVDIYIPQQTRKERALLVINNGSNVAGKGAGPATAAPTDFKEETLANLARSTQMIVVSLAYAPNQYLQLPGDSQPRKEDDLIGETWRRFLDNPPDHRTLPLHVPMAEAAVRAMDLAQRELAAWEVQSFVVTGVSKRAWATWLTAIGDERVAAVVPFVIGMNIQPLIPYIRRSYGGAWPIALRDYYNHGILDRYEQPAFAELMKVEDPYAYRLTRYGRRLQIPKYIVNASGDDFFPPDVSRFYIDRLPGPASQRVVPNSDHYGIKGHLEESLIPVLKRWNEGRALPFVRSSLHVGTRLELIAQASQPPKSARLWVAENPTGRDFRYACGVSYREVPASLNGGKVIARLDKPQQGWLALFAELTYADGLVATSSVHIYPEQSFPSVPPPDERPACSTIGKDAAAPQG